MRQQVMNKTLHVTATSDDQTQDPRATLIDAGRILAREGHNGGLAGQVTVRDDDSPNFWSYRLGVGLEELTPDDLLLVSPAVECVQGHGDPNPGVRFHAWIYQRHPQIRSIVHTHSPAASAFAMLGQPFPVAHMDTCMFFDDCGFLERWPGVPTGDEEGALIAEALDGKRTAFLANHGCVCTGQSLREATYLAVYAERGARLALDAMAAGKIAPINPEAAREAHDFLLQPSIVNATFAYWSRQASL